LASAYPPAFTPLLKFGILQYFYLAFWWNKVRILLQHLLRPNF
jgi:hypothetical protein